jgi:hypothetical protein
MSSSDWSNHLVLGNLVPGNQISGDLAPASAVRPVESPASNQDAGGARRARQKEKEEDPDHESPFSPGEQPEHCLDHLA